MKIIDTKDIFCSACMEKHKIDVVVINEDVLFRDKEINADFIYHYCKETDTLIETEDLIRKNFHILAQAYEMAR